MYHSKVDSDSTFRCLVIHDSPIIALSDSLFKFNLDLEVFLKVAADVAVADKVNLQISKVFSAGALRNFGFTYLEGQLGLNGRLRLEVGYLLDREKLACLSVAYHDPPLLALLLGIELGVDGPIEDLKSLFVVLVFFFSLQSDNEFDRLFVGEGAYWVIFSCTFRLELDLDQWVPITHIGEVCHLVV